MQSNYMPSNGEDYNPVPEFNPFGGGENALQNHSYSELVPEKREMVIDFSGQEHTVSTPDRVVSGSYDERVVEPPSLPDNNKKDEISEDYIERLNNLISAYTDYKSLLKTFGKDDIKEVLEEAKNSSLLSQNQASLFDNVDNSKGPNIL